MRVSVTFVGESLLDFRLKAWEHLAQGEPLRRNPGFTDRYFQQSEGLRAASRERWLSALQAETFYGDDPGRRRQASLPWAECCQAFSLKTKNASAVNKFPTNSRDAHLDYSSR